MITLVAWKLITLLLGFMCAGMVIGSYIAWKNTALPDDIWGGGTVTGRVSCDSPNTSNVPKPTYYGSPHYRQEQDKGQYIDKKV